MLSLFIVEFSELNIMLIAYFVIGPGKYNFINIFINGQISRNYC